MKNTIHLNGFVQKRDQSDFSDEQSKELAERIQAVVKTLGYVFVEPTKEPATEKKADG